MRSATSFFNAALYKKNLSRFWPLWVSWMVLWLFVMPLNLINQWRDYSQDNSLYGIYRLYYNYLKLNGDVSEGGMFIGVVFAVLTVMAVFGYLFNHRSAATFHALPLRRETLFITNYLSGLTFFLLPNIVVYAATALVELTTIPAELSAVALSALWSGFWVKTGVELFFYSFAVFCAQFTGNVLALPAFYGILNILVVAMYQLCVSIADIIYYGGWLYSGEPALVKYLTPFYALYEATIWDSISWSDVWDYELEVPVFGKTLELGFESPATIAAYAAAGIVLAVLALMVYRRRHIETAGDVVSVKIVRPIFRAGVAVCAGLSGGIVMAAFFGWYEETLPMAVSILVWTVIGFFVAEMLLQKSFKVFRKAWKSCLVTTGVMALFIAACFMDVFGVETWVPETGEVKEVNININSTYPYDEASYLSKLAADSVEKEKIINIHQSIIDDYEEHGEHYFGDELMHISLQYVMENGRVINRRYSDIDILQSEINTPGTTTFQIDQFVNEPQMIDYAYDMETARRGKIVSVELVNVVHPDGSMERVEIAQGAEEIWAAVQADFAAGNLGKRYLFDDEVRRTETYFTDLQLRFLIPEEEQDPDIYYEYYEMYMAEVQQVKPTEESAYVWNWNMTVTLTPKAERTIRALEKYSELGAAYDIALH